jgi:hypothetical protein
MPSPIFGIRGTTLIVQHNADTRRTTPYEDCIRAVRYAYTTSIAHYEQKEIVAAGATATAMDDEFEAERTAAAFKKFMLNMVSTGEFILLRRREQTDALSTFTINYAPDLRHRAGPPAAAAIMPAAPAPSKKRRAGGELTSDRRAPTSANLSVDEDHDFGPSDVGHGNVAAFFRITKAAEGKTIESINALHGTDNANTRYHERRNARIQTLQRESIDAATRLNTFKFANSTINSADNTALIRLERDSRDKATALEEYQNMSTDDLEQSRHDASEDDAKARLFVAFEQSVRLSTHTKESITRSVVEYIKRAESRTNPLTGEDKDALLRKYYAAATNMLSENMGDAGPFVKLLRHETEQRETTGPSSTAAKVEMNKEMHTTQAQYRAMVESILGIAPGGYEAFANTSQRVHAVEMDGIRGHGYEIAAGGFNRNQQSAFYTEAGPVHTPTAYSELLHNEIVGYREAVPARFDLSAHRMNAGMSAKPLVPPDESELEFVPEEPLFKWLPTADERHRLYKNSLREIQACLWSTAPVSEVYHSWRVTLFSAVREHDEAGPARVRPPLHVHVDETGAGRCKDEHGASEVVVVTRHDGREVIIQFEETDAVTGVPQPLCKLSMNNTTKKIVATDLAQGRAYSEIHLECMPRNGGVYYHDFKFEHRNHDILPIFHAETGDRATLGSMEEPEMTEYGVRRTIIKTNAWCGYTIANCEVATKLKTYVNIPLTEQLDRAQAMDTFRQSTMSSCIWDICNHMENPSQVSVRDSQSILTRIEDYMREVAIVDHAPPIAELNLENMYTLTAVNMTDQFPQPLHTVPELIFGTYTTKTSPHFVWCNHAPTAKLDALDAVVAYIYTPTYVQQTGVAAINTFTVEYDKYEDARVYAENAQTTARVRLAAQQAQRLAQINQTVTRTLTTVPDEFKPLMTHLQTMADMPVEHLLPAIDGLVIATETVAESATNADMTLRECYATMRRRAAHAPAVLSAVDIIIDGFPSTRREFEVGAPTDATPAVRKAAHLGIRYARAFSACIRLYVDQAKRRNASSTVWTQYTNEAWAANMMALHEWEDEIYRAFSGKHKLLDAGEFEKYFAQLARFFDANKQDSPWAEFVVRLQLMAGVDALRPRIHLTPAGDDDDDDGDADS